METPYWPQHLLIVIVNIQMIVMESILNRLPERYKRLWHIICMCLYIAFEKIYYRILFFIKPHLKCYY